MIAESKHQELRQAFEQFKSGREMRMGRFTAEERARLEEGLKVVRDGQLQKREIAGKTDEIVAIQLIKGMGFVNVIIDAYGPKETLFTLDDNSFHVFVERLKGIDALELGHDMFTFQRIDDRCPEMESGDE